MSGVGIPLPVVLQPLAISKPSWTGQPSTRISNARRLRRVCFQPLCRACIPRLRRACIPRLRRICIPHLPSSPMCFRHRVPVVLQLVCRSQSETVSEALWARVASVGSRYPSAGCGRRLEWCVSQGRVLQYSLSAVHSELLYVSMVSEAKGK